MSPNRVIEAAIRAAQDFLWQNAPPMHYVADEATVARLRRPHAFARRPGGLAAKQRRVFHLRAAGNRSRGAGPLADRPRDHRPALGCARRAAPEPRLGHPAEFPHFVRPVSPPALSAGGGLLARATTAT